MHRADLASLCVDPPTGPPLPATRGPFPRPLSLWVCQARGSEHGVRAPCAARELQAVARLATAPVPTGFAGVREDLGMGKHPGCSCRPRVTARVLARGLGGRRDPGTLGTMRTWPGTRGRPVAPGGPAPPTLTSRTVRTVRSVQGPKLAVSVPAAVAASTSEPPLALCPEPVLGPHVPERPPRLCSRGLSALNAVCQMFPRCCRLGDGSLCRQWAPWLPASPSGTLVAMAIAF